MLLISYFLSIDSTSKNYKLLLVTELMFCNYPKANGKIPIGNKCDANLEKYIIAKALYTLGV